MQTFVNQKGTVSYNWNRESSKVLFQKCEISNFINFPVLDEVKMIGCKVHSFRGFPKVKKLFLYKTDISNVTDWKDLNFDEIVTGDPETKKKNKVILKVILKNKLSKLGG